MIRLITIIVSAIFFCLSMVNAQELPRNERNSAGMLINQDYFIAGQYKELRENLEIVERIHLNERVMNDLWVGRASGIADLNYTLDKFANHPKALMLLGIGARIRKTPLLPIAYYERALRLYPQYALTHAQYGGYLAEIGQINEGIAKLQRAIEMDPKLALAYEWLSKAYTKIGNLEMAGKTAEKAKELGLKTGQ